MNWKKELKKDKRSDIIYIMVFKLYKQQPIIIGLSGRAGSGKTSVAESIVPKGSFANSKHGAIWDHIFYALPLYEFLSSKKNIKGINEESRKKYAIHETLYDLYGNSSLGMIPDYDTFIDKVNKIYDLQLDPTATKQRSFLQKAGDICRDGYEDCFCHWSIKKTLGLYRSYIKSLEEDDDEKPFIVLISDVRFENEAKSILKMPNGYVIYFDADDETLNSRLMKRDGRISTPEQSSHISEQQLSKVKDMASFIVDTNNLSIEGQVNETLKLLGFLQEKHA
jgi:dephospho-CoA kinase